MTIQEYSLAVDGPLFRRQRLLLLRLAESARHKRSMPADALDAELLEGLVNLTDSIADQAIDRYGIDGRLRR